MNSVVKSSVDPGLAVKMTTNCTYHPYLPNLPPNNARGNWVWILHQPLYGQMRGLWLPSGILSKNAVIIYKRLTYRRQNPPRTPLLYQTDENAGLTPSLIGGGGTYRSRDVMIGNENECADPHSFQTKEFALEHLLTMYTHTCSCGIEYDDDLPMHPEWKICECGTMNCRI